jgi:hypothetical protein
MLRPIFPALLLCCLYLSYPALLHAQSPDEPKPIEDNSFMLEEAYNQEPGVVQHMLKFERNFDTKDWGLALEQEWPLWSQEHQFSYEIPLQSLMSATPLAVTGIGDIAISYRYQLLGIEDHDLALAPRLSVILPTGNAEKGLGNGALGYEIGLPFSRFAEPFAFHTNASIALTPNAKMGTDHTTSIMEVSLGQSVIWLLHPKFNIMLEGLWSEMNYRAADSTLQSEESFIINPGIRWAHDFDSGLQIVPGISVPMELGEEGSMQIFLYLSLEHNF